MINHMAAYTMIQAVVGAEIFCRPANAPALPGYRVRDMWLRNSLGVIPIFRLNSFIMHSG